MIIQHDRDSYRRVAKVLLRLNPTASTVCINYDKNKPHVEQFADWIESETNIAINSSTTDGVCRAGYWDIFGVHVSYGHTGGETNFPVYGKAALSNYMMDEVLILVEKAKHQQEKAR